MHKHIVFLRNPEEPPAWGGLEKLMLDWFKRIDYNGCTVTLAVSSHWVRSFEQKLKDEKIPVNVIALPYGHKQGKVLTRFFKLFFFLHALRPSSIIFIEGWLYSFNFAEVLAGSLASGGRVYMHENLGPPMPSPKSSKRHFGILKGMGIWWHIQIYLVKFRALISKNVLVVSKEIKEKLITWWCYPASKVLIKYHGINLENYHSCLGTRKKMRESLNIPQDEIVIVAASRLSKEKCVDRALHAFEALSSRRPGMSLMILGDGVLKENLMALTMNMSSAAKIRFMGHVDNVEDYFKMSDIYILSSDNEGFGIALVEAMATGLICVATKSPGPNEIIQDGINGFLVAKSVEGVLDGIQQALALSEDRKTQMSQEAIHFVSENFEINQRIRDVFSVLGIKGLEAV